MHGETWQAIPGYDGYEASTAGRIRSLKRGTPRILRPSTSGQYLTLTLYVGSKHDDRVYKTVHELVALAFIGPREEGMTINHANGVKTDNRPSNLEYVSHKKNLRHALKNDLRKMPRGTDHWQGRFTPDQIKQIRHRCKHLGHSQASIARESNVSRSTIGDIIHRRTYSYIQ